MRTKKALHNFKVDLLITFLLVLLGFYIRTVFVSKMGSDITGVMLLFTQLTAYLNLAELGIGIAAASVLYKPLSENEYNKITYIISLLSVIYKYIFVFVLILGVVIGICIYYFIDSVKVVNGVFLYWALFVFNTSLTYSYAKYSTLLTANQRYSAVRKIQGGGKVIIIVFQILILCFTQSFILYLLVETLGIFSQYLIFKKIIGNGNQYLSNEVLLIESDKLLIKKELKIRIKNMFFHKIGAVLVLNTDYLLVSKFLTLSYVTIFGSYMMVFQIVTVLMSSFVNAITAGMGNYLINKSNLEIKENTRQFYVIFIAFATFISLNMFFLVNDFIAKWIGVNYTLSNTLVALMIVNVFISVVRVPSDILKNASGHFGDIYYPLLEGVLNITISIILAIIIGLPGIIIGTIVSNLIVIMLAKPLYLYSKLFNLRNPTRVYFEFISRPMLYSLCVIGVSYLLRDEIYSFKVSTWLDFINKLLLVSTPSILVICAIFSTDSDFRLFFRKIIYVIMKK